MTTLNPSQYSVKKVQLVYHTLEEIANALKKGLAKNYAEIEVRITECPDLTKEPYGLAAEGLCGDPCVIQVGDPAYVIPDTLLDKLYEFGDIAQITNLKDAFIIGCGGGPWPRINYFSEMIANAVIKNGEIKCYTKNIYTDDNAKKTIKLVESPSDECRFSVLGSLFASQGLRGTILEVHCERRIGSDNLSQAIYNCLNAEFNDPIALGVVFETLKGTVKHHVAPGFAKGVKNALDWLNLHFIPAPVISVGTIISRNPENHSLLKEHFHSYTTTNHKQEATGGHYHYDVTPDIVQYRAYISPAKLLYVIDEAENPITLF